MKKFITKCFLFFFVIFFILLTGFLISSKLIKENIHYSIYDKHKLLTAKKEKPRIILVGGSNLSFGIYSPLIEREFNVNVINTGIYASYGLKYIIDDIKPFIKEGDIVVLSPEYNHFFDDFFYGGQALIQGLSVYPKNWRNLNWRQILTVIKFFPKESLVKIKSYLTTFIKPMDIVDSYHRKSFNSNGDAVKHWGVTKKKPTPIIHVKGKFNDAALDYVSEFSKYIKEKNAYMYFSFPGLNQSSFKKSEQAINILYSRILSKDIKVIEKPIDYSIPDSLHYDTSYHLTKEGQYFRTNKLIRGLKKHGLEQLIQQQ